MWGFMAYGQAGAAGVAPDQNANQLDRPSVSKAERREIADEVAESHRRGLSKRRPHDLTAEKYMLHVDGEGDAQWADIFNGQTVAIPSNLSGSPRAQHNLLRPIVDNHVAYHTTQPFEFAVQAAPSREAREAARIDQILLNQVAERQRWNALFAEALYLASCFGHCPVHAYWRDDMASDPYEPLYLDREEVQNPPRRGHVDCWVGDPWDTVYNPGATRTSVHEATYGRTIPAQIVRQAFADAIAEQGVNLEGSDKLPSASRFQRAVRDWLVSGLNVHGTASASYGSGEEQEEELIALVCREQAPNVDPEWPDGRLTIVALNGAASTDESDTFAGGHAYGDPVLLHDGPLPGGAFSFVRVYSTHRFDDVLGKPFVSDLDDLQVQLNQLYTMLNQYLRRATRAPWAVPNGSEPNMETAYWDWDAMLEYDPPVTGSATGSIFPLEPPGSHVEVLQSQIEHIQSTMFRIGGWQAASRGEADSGDSGRKVIALAKADDTIHGPTNQRFRETVEDFAGLVWKLHKEYMDIPQMIEATGDEVAHLAEPWIDRTQLSDKEPDIKLISGFGATPEAQAEQLLKLMQTQDPVTGEPLLSAEQVRKRWPDNMTFPEEESSDSVARRRPRQINARIKRIASRVAQRRQIPDNAPPAHPQIMQMALLIDQQVQQQFPILMDDDVAAHLEELRTFTQDETEHPLVRAVAMSRQRHYMMMAQQQQQRQMERQQQMEEGSGESDAFGPTEGGTTSSEGLRQADESFDQQASMQAMR